MRWRRCLGWLVIAIAFTSPASAQQILIDQGVRVEGLWCFPSALDPSQWYYVPQQARPATDDRGMPVFSYLRYVVNRRSEDSAGQGMTEADGGGIVTLVTTYDTPTQAVRRAEDALREVSGDDEAVLRGPVIFESGRYVLVSSILRENGEDDTLVLAAGNAPVFEGNEVAFSFDIGPEESTLLLESFKMATPDVSIVYEMTVKGLSDAFDATLTVDWEQVDKSEAFTMGGRYYWMAGEIEQGFEEMRRNNAIELVTRGANERMEALLAKVHEKLLAMMFQRLEPEKAAQDGGPPGSTAAGAGAGGAEGMNPLASLTGPMKDFSENPGQLTKTLSPVNITGTYARKEVRKSGKTRIHLNNQAPVERNIMLAANIGDLFKRFGDDSNVFRTVNLSDPAYQQREIRVGLDGSILPEFEKYINSVTVTLRKKHQNGRQTLQEIVVDPRVLNAESRDLRMIYGWNGDSDRARWLEYEYRTRWSFKGGGLHETDWLRTETNMIDLYAPYRRNTVELIADPDALAEQQVRGVAVRVEYDFFNGQRSEDLSFHQLDQIDGKELELTLPLNVFDYRYFVTWIRRGMPPLEASGRDDTGVIFVDDLPEEPAAEAEAG